MSEPTDTAARDAAERLVLVVQELSQAHDLDSIVAIVREAARSLTGADGATFVLRDGESCHYVDESAIAPLWKGRRFPLSTCISGWAMLNARPAVIEDIYADARIPADAYRPTFVKSLAMVPIRRSAPIGAIGNYWATRRKPTAEEVAVLQALADTTSVALENAQLYGELQERLRALAEKEARIREQRDALDVFTRALAHDLKEPVRTIHSFTRLLEDPACSAETTGEYLGFVGRAAERMRMLIDTVFHYTQLDDPAALEREPVDLDASLGAARENLTSLIERGRAVVTSDPLPRVQASPGHMMQLLQNLVGNAVRHGGDGVHVHVGARIGVGECVLTVADDGPGIPADRLESVFQPFKRLSRADDCSGLGLAICRKIVALHGGRIWCESGNGRGARFYVALPHAADPAPGGPVEDVPGEPPADLARVLIVDDMAADVELIRVILFRRDGLECELSVARDGSEALRAVREAARRGAPIDLVLLDINMPGMDGFEFLEQLRSDRELGETAVVMCTGSTYEKDRHRARALGALGTLVKPPSRDAFCEVLRGVERLRVQSDRRASRLVRVG